eukprot:m.133070 g.133070  ORF g.133070 m.133070 type:complete len:52 (-) comp16872_c0_seq2:837-992(-)
MCQPHSRSRGWLANAMVQAKGVHFPAIDWHTRRPPLIPSCSTLPLLLLLSR